MAANKVSVACKFHYKHLKFKKGEQVLGGGRSMMACAKNILTLGGRY